MLAAALLVGRMIIVLCFVFQLLAIGSLESKAGIIKETPEGLTEAAEEILTEYFKSERMQTEGFPPYFYPEENLLDFSLGEPFPFYRLDIPVVYELENTEYFKKALILNGWYLPIYMGNETEPRTYLLVKKENDRKWRNISMGGTYQNINQAREKWPSKDGYLHALLTAEAFYLPRLIAVEKSGELNIFFFSQDSLLAKDFGLSRNDEGYFPAISIEKFTSHIKKDEKYERKIKRIYNRNN